MNKNKKQEYVNDKHVEDWNVSGGKIIPDFSGHIYEKKFLIKTTAETQKLLEQKYYWKDKISKIVSACKLDGATCRFDFGSRKNIDLDVQKKLIDFQAEIFDDITVQLINNNITDFKEALIYAKKKYPKITIATYADIGSTRRVLDEYHNIVSETFDKNKDYLKYKYRKITTWLNQYTVIKEYLNKTSSYALLTGCYKRCGIDQYRNIAVPIIALGKLGFNATCTDVIYHKGGFAVFVDVFNANTWEIDKLKTKDAKELLVDIADLDMPEYKRLRLTNFNEINQAINSLSSTEINKRNLVKKLFEHLAAAGL